MLEDCVAKTNLLLFSMLLFSILAGQGTVATCACEPFQTCACEAFQTVASHSFPETKVADANRCIQLAAAQRLEKLLEDNKSLR